MVLRRLFPWCNERRGDGAVTAARGPGVRPALPPTPAVLPGAELLPASPEPRGATGDGDGLARGPTGWGGCLGSPLAAPTPRGSQHGPAPGESGGATTGWTPSLLWLFVPVSRCSHVSQSLVQPHVPVPRVAVCPQPQCGFKSLSLAQHCVLVPSAAACPHPRCSCVSLSPVQPCVPIPGAAACPIPNTAACPIPSAAPCPCPRCTHVSFFPVCPSPLMQTRVPIPSTTHRPISSATARPRPWCIRVSRPHCSCTSLSPAASVCPIPGVQRWVLPAAVPGRFPHAVD